MCYRSRGDRQGGQGDVVYPIGYSEKPVPDTSIQETDKNLVEKVSKHTRSVLLKLNLFSAIIWNACKTDRYFLKWWLQEEKISGINIWAFCFVTNVKMCCCALVLLLLYSVAGMLPWGPSNRSQWTCSSCTCRATPSPFSPSWWCAWWPGGPYRRSCPCLPVSIEYLPCVPHILINRAVNVHL